jgi:hypothetical protein
MWTLFLVIALYLFSAGFFAILGGLGGAADALEGWGRNSATVRGSTSPASS